MHLDLLSYAFRAFVVGIQAYCPRHTDLLSYVPERVFLRVWALLSYALAMRCPVLAFAMRYDPRY